MMSPAENEESSDEMLALRVAEGDMEALGEIYVRHGAMVKKALYRFAPGIGEHQVEDLSQDVFLKLMRPETRYEEQGRFRAWLYGIAVNLARRWRRRHGLRLMLSGPLEKALGRASQEADRSPEHIAANRELVSEAINKLPAGSREVLILHEVEGFTGEEIANILGLSAGAVWTRLHRARRRLIATCQSTPARGSILGEKP